MLGLNLTSSLAELGSAELIRLRIGVEAEMKRRGDACTVGAMGEALAISHFNSTPGLPNLQRSPTGTKNVDCLSRHGDRYSIKTLWKAKKTGTVYPDPSQADKPLFEYLLVVRLNERWELHSLARFSWQQFLVVRRWDRRMSAWYLTCADATFAQGEWLVPPEVPRGSDAASSRVSE